MGHVTVLQTKMIFLSDVYDCSRNDMTYLLRCIAARTVFPLVWHAYNNGDKDDCETDAVTFCKVFGGNAEIYMAVFNGIVLVVLFAGEESM